MLSFITNKEHELILSIGSGSVTGSIVEFKKDSKPSVLHVSESLFPVREGVDGEKIVSHMLSALHFVLGNLHKEHAKKIRNVHVIFASPWFSSTSKSISIKKDAPFTVTSKALDAITEDFLEKFLNAKDDTSSDRVSTANPLAKNATIIEKSTSHIRLNGYETNEPLGKVAKTLDLTMYISSVPSVLHEKVESEIYTIIHPKQTHFHSLPLTAWNVINKLFSPKDDFVFIDIGSEVTDLLITKQGIIQTIISFPIGQNHLLRKAAIHFDTEPELASSMVNLYATDTAEDSTKEKVKILVDAFAEEWILKLISSIQGKNNEHGYLPKKSFFISEQNLLSIFSDIIKKQIPNTVGLSRENLSDFVSFEGNSTPNTFIAIGAIYLQPKF
jgi:cell division ATPase FtsA